jgi:pilus assembly protein Flp/PilA
MQLLNNLLLNVIAWATRDREEGQTLVEYALIIALVAIVLVGALTALEGGINGVFGDIVNAFYDSFGRRGSAGRGI